MTATTFRPLRAAAVAATTLAATVAVVFAGAGAAQAGVHTEVKFAAGSSGTAINGAVVRGDADSYVLEARRGQVMSVSASSLEKNVNFSISGPDGSSLVVADTETEIALPADGYYRVVVSPTRGNATYRLILVIH